MNTDREMLKHTGQVELGAEVPGRRLHEVLQQVDGTAREAMDNLRPIDRVESAQEMLGRAEHSFRRLDAAIGSLFQAAFGVSDPALHDRDPRSLEVAHSLGLELGSLREIQTVRQGFADIIQRTHHLVGSGDASMDTGLQGALETLRLGLENLCTLLRTLADNLMERIRDLSHPPVPELPVPDPPSIEPPASELPSPGPIPTAAVPVPQPFLIPTTPIPQPLPNPASEPQPSVDINPQPPIDINPQPIPGQDPVPDPDPIPGPPPIPWPDPAADPIPTPERQPDPQLFPAPNPFSTSVPSPETRPEPNPDPAPSQGPGTGPEGQGIIGTPNADAPLVFQQGNNDLSETMTCAVAGQAIVLNHFEGTTSHTENELLHEAKTHGWYDQGTALEDYGKVCELHGIHVERRESSLTELVSRLSQNQEAQVSVNAGILWDDVQYLGNGSHNHAVVVTGVREDSSGNVISVFIDDTGDGKFKEVPVDRFMKAWDTSNDFAAYYSKE